MKIGVFDSGNGGYTTLGAIRSLLPENEYYYISDHKNCPYGTKTQAELIEITTHIAQQLASWGAEMIVIACNTATTRCIRALRQRFPDIIFVGTEPAIKLACDADCQEILLLATPQTIASRQVGRLLEQNIKHQRIHLLPCPGLADLIENQTMFSGDFNKHNNKKFQLKHPELVIEKLDELTKDLPTDAKIDAVVLGCTHYILAREQIQSYFPKTQLFDGNFGVAKRIQSLQNINKLPENSN